MGEYSPNHEFPLHKSTSCLGHSKLSSKPAPTPIWCYYTIMHDFIILFIITTAVKA